MCLQISKEQSISQQDQNMEKRSYASEYERARAYLHPCIYFKCTLIYYWCIQVHWMMWDQRACHELNTEMMLRENEWSLHHDSDLMFYLLSRSSKYDSPDMKIKSRIRASRAMRAGQTQTQTPPGTFCSFSVF